MNLDDEKKRLVEIEKILSLMAKLLVLTYLFMKFGDKLPSAGIVSPETVFFLVAGGYIHVRYSDTMAYLYNRNRFGPRTTGQINKIIGTVLLVAGGICAGLLVWITFKSSGK